MYVLKVLFWQGLKVKTIRSQDFECESESKLNDLIAYWQKGNAYIDHKVLMITPHYLPQTISGLSEVANPSF